jgi:hypothetical protein
MRTVYPSVQCSGLKIVDVDVGRYLRELLWPQLAA